MQQRVFELTKNVSYYRAFAMLDYTLTIFAPKSISSKIETFLAHFQTLCTMLCIVKTTFKREAPT